jgi:hypothetical protein
VVVAAGVPTGPRRDADQREDDDQRNARTAQPPGAFQNRQEARFQCVVDQAVGAELWQQLPQYALRRCFCDEQ